MSTIATELDTAIAALPRAAAQRLESAVRSEIEKATCEEHEMKRALELMRQRKPELADLIGSLADLEFELPPDLPLPPAKGW